MEGGAFTRDAYDDGLDNDDQVTLVLEGDPEAIGEMRNALVRAETDVQLSEEADAERRARQVPLPTEFELPPALTNNMDLDTHAVLNVMNTNGSLHVNPNRGTNNLLKRVPADVQATVRTALKERNAKDVTVASDPDLNEEKRAKLIDQRMSEVLASDLMEDMPDSSLLYDLYSYAMNTDPNWVISNADADGGSELLHSKKLFGRHTFDVLYGDMSTAMSALSEYMHEQLPPTPVIVRAPTNPRALDSWRGTRQSVRRSIHTKLQKLGHKWMKSVGADPSNVSIRNMINAKLRAMADVFARGHAGDPSILDDSRPPRAPHPSQNRKLRALANIMRPKGCVSRASVRAVPYDVTGGGRGGGRDKKNNSDTDVIPNEEGGRTRNNLALIDTRTGEPIRTLGELNAVLSSSDPTVQNASRLAYTGSTSGGIESLLRNPTRMVNGLGTYVGDDINDAYTRRMYGRMAQHPTTAGTSRALGEDDIEFLLRSSGDLDTEQQSMENDINYLFGTSYVASPPYGGGR